MLLHVMKMAEPADLKGLVIIQVERPSFQGTADFTRSTLDLPALQINGHVRAGIVLTPLLRVQRMRLAPEPHILGMVLKAAPFT